MATQVNTSSTKKIIPYPEDPAENENEKDNVDDQNNVKEQDGSNTESSHQSKTSASPGASKKVRVMDEDIKNAVGSLMTSLKTTFGDKIKEKRMERLLMKVASAANSINDRVKSTRKVIQVQVMEDLALAKKDYELQQNVNIACEKIVENSAKSVERMNRLRLIQEEIAENKKHMEQTKFHNQTYQEALSAIGEDITTGQDKNENAEQKPSLVPTITKETEDLIRMYNKLMIGK